METVFATMGKVEGMYRERAGQIAGALVRDTVLVQGELLQVGVPQRDRDARIQRDNAGRQSLGALHDGIEEALQCSLQGMRFQLRA